LRRFDHGIANKGFIPAFRSLFLTAALAAAPPAVAAVVDPGSCSTLKDKKVLVLPGNSNYQSMAATLQNLKTMAAKVPFSKTVGDPLKLSDAVLAGYDIIVFNYFFKTQSSEVFPDSCKAAFMRWLKLGNKAYVGYNTSGANEWSRDEWRDYQDSVTGMRFALHGSGTPQGRVEATADSAVLASPIMQGLPDHLSMSDEWYEYQLDSKIFDPAMNWKFMYYLANAQAINRSPPSPNHPVAWFRTDGNGTRYFYTTMGWSPDFVNGDFFKSLLLRALEFGAGYDCSTAIANSNAGGKTGLHVTVNRELRVDLDGAYRMSVWSPVGRRLLAAEGSGGRSFSLASIQRKGLCVVKIDTKSGSFTRKILID
jgi:type 1 glutamine amidotransferase